MVQERKNKEQNSAPGMLDIEVPDTGDLLAKLDQAHILELRREHREETEEEEKKEKAGQKPKKRQTRSGTICCCGVPMCRIGPFVNTEGKEDASA